MSIFNERKYCGNATPYQRLYVVEYKGKKPIKFGRNGQNAFTSERDAKACITRLVRDTSATLDDLRIVHYIREPYVIDDNDQPIHIGDTVCNYYNIANGIDQRGDGYVKEVVRDYHHLVQLHESQDSKGRCVRKLD